MGLDNVTAVYLAGTNTTIVRALRTGETTLGPSVWLAIFIEESILLLETEPRFLALVSLHELGALVTIVEFVGCAVRIPALSQDENVVAATEWIRKHGDRTEVDVRVLTWSLGGGRSVEVPFWKILDGVGLLLESLS